MFRRELRAARLSDPGVVVSVSPRARLTLAVVLASAVAYLFGGHLAWTAVAGFVLLMLLHRRDTRALWAHIDWSLLVFFAALFVVVGGLTASGAPAAFFERFPLSDRGGAGGWLELGLIFLVGSNVVSNVPFILVVRDQMATLSDSRLGWEVLAMATTFAGNLTLLGSVANIIVAEAGRDVGGMGFWQYLRVGFPLALSTTLLGLAWLLLVTGNW
jgi:Na+/H+ antiporter NhaD/arsenite permease-like protein